MMTQLYNWIQFFRVSERFFFFEIRILMFTITVRHAYKFFIPCSVSHFDHFTAVDQSISAGILRFLD